jgi:hypothetical protein
MGVLLVENLLAALGASLLTGGFVWVWRVFFDPRRKQKRRRAVLGFDVDETDFAPTIIVESTRPAATSRYLRPTAGYGAVLAAANVAQLIGVVRSKTRRFAKLEVWMDTDQIATRALSEESQHAIVIGGPMSNTETRRYLDWLNDKILDGSLVLHPSDVLPPNGQTDRAVQELQPICFDDDDRDRGRALVVDGKLFRASMVAAGGEPVAASAISQLSGRDYGLVVRGPARNLSGRLIIIAGVHTFGLAGASQFLVQLSAVRRFSFSRQRMRMRRDILTALRYLAKPENEDMLLVVRTDFENGVITATTPVAAWRIRPTQRGIEREANRPA